MVASGAHYWTDCPEASVAKRCGIRIDGFGDSAICGGLRGGVGVKVAGDKQLGAPSRRDIGDEKPD